jgi:hypothetical protein
MATKPRAAKAPAPAAKTTRAASSTLKTAAGKAPAKPVKPVVKPAVKAAAKPVVKAKAVVKSVVKSVMKPVAKAAVKPVAKPGAKTVAKPAAKPAVKRAAATLPAAMTRPVKAAAAVQPPAGNPTLVRDSFTMPEAEYAVFASAKQRCLQAGVEIKKSELLRIGMTLVGQLDVTMLQAVLAGLPQLKTGRPRSEQ